MDNIKKIKKESNSYLSFKIDEELYAVHVAHTHSIIEVPRIIEMPETPDYVKGVLNLRGSVLPVIDMRVKFKLPASEITNETSILVLEIRHKGGTILIGALIDQVHEVLVLNEEEINQPPKIDSLDTTNSFIEGMVEIDDQLLMVLNINALFDSEYIENVSKQLVKQDL